MKIISALLDKSVFQRLAEQPAELQNQIWNHLHTHYQVVVPPILIEEVVTNVADPGEMPHEVIREMFRRLVLIRSCWMEDIFEIAFQELVMGQPLKKLPAFPPQLVEHILNLKPGDPELLKWVTERKADRKFTVQMRTAAQDEMLPRQERKRMKDEVEFWERLKNQFLNILGNPERRTELLEVVFGEVFRRRHPDSLNAITDAFERFNQQTYTAHYVTLAILMVRLAYVYAPLVQFEHGAGKAVRRFIGRSIADQQNNAADEQYIVAAMICSRLLTRDEGMNNVIEMFRINGFTSCRTHYLDPRGSFVEQILQLKD